MFSDEAIEHFATLVAAKVLSKLMSASVDGWVAHEASPLGRRRHIALARKIGKQIGRRYFLPLAEVEKAMTELTVQSRAKTPKTAVSGLGDIDEELAAELKLRPRAA